MASAAVARSTVDAFTSISPDRECISATTSIMPDSAASSACSPRHPSPRMFRSRRIGDQRGGYLRSACPNPGSKARVIVDPRSSSCWPLGIGAYEPSRLSPQTEVV